MLEPVDISDGNRQYIISNKEVQLAFAVLICLIILIMLEIKIIKDLKISAETSVRLIVVTLVILGSLFVIMAGYTDTQIAPIFALFGTICGYLFGKRERRILDDKQV